MDDALKSSLDSLNREDTVYFDQSDGEDDFNVVTALVGSQFQFIRMFACQIQFKCSGNVLFNQIVHNFLLRVSLTLSSLPPPSIPFSH